MAKNLLVICAIVLGIYYFTRSEPTPPEVAAVATPAPKLYYHSPLDAPAMANDEHTDLGYFSPDAAPGFHGNRAELGASGAVGIRNSGAYPTTTTSGFSVSNTSITINSPGAALRSNLGNPQTNVSLRSTVPASTPVPPTSTRVPAY